MVDGSVEYIRNLSEMLTERNHEVSVLCTDALFYIFQGERYEPRTEKRNGVTVKRAPFYYMSKYIEFALSFGFKKISRPVSPWTSALFQDPGGVKILIEGLRNNHDFDIIHTTPIPRSCIAAAVLIGNFTATPTLVRPAFHLSDERTDFDLWKPVLQQAAGIVCATNFEAKRLAQAGFDKSQLHVVGCGVNYHIIEAADPDPNVLDENQFTVLSLSSGHSESKGTYQIIRAARKLPDVRFLFAGSGWNSIEEEIEIPPNCEYLGYLEEDRKHNIYNSVDLFVQPSISESFGIVFMEALSAGVPVIPADTPQMRELYSDVGVPVTHGDPDELAAVIESLQTDPNRYQQLVDRAPDLAMKYTWGEIASQIESLYQSQI